MGSQQAADSVARIVERRAEPQFVDLVRSADREFGRAGFEEDLARTLRANPELINSWTLWSADQRWTPCAYVDGHEAGWFDGVRRYLRVHADEASAVAYFIHRLAAWLARRQVIETGD